MRQPYEGPPLRRADLAAHPMEQFHRWFTQARAAGLTEPNAMVVATVEPSGAPRARTVLLKGYDRSGLRFFTNYGSRKGRALDDEPRVSAVFPWHAMRRQVQVAGRAQRLTDAENDAYFHSRPRGSQIGAWASERQSHRVADRAALDALYAEFADVWSGVEEIPRPSYWGGYRILVEEVEFWQGRADRMHDRFCYTLAAGGPAEGDWELDRLAP
nr:pyridoxamine 5'-phosphate oxidase [Streptomonospora sp. PA3]